MSFFKPHFPSSILREVNQGIKVGGGAVRDGVAWVFESSQFGVFA